jgi:nucleotide-binding universal stress UspA family protein
VWSGDDHGIAGALGLELGTRAPEGGWPELGGGGRPDLRLLVTVQSLSRAHNALLLAARFAGVFEASLRLVHLRLWDRVPQTGGRFYPESSLAATEVVDAALEQMWRAGASASGIVLDAPRAGLADAVVAEADEWGADVLMVSLCRHHVSVFGLGVWDRMARQVLRRTPLPVVVVRSGVR